MTVEALGRLRSTALTAVLVGAVGSVGFLVRASQNSPQRLLMVIIAAWVAAPFLGLVLADVISTRWSALTRKALHIVMFVIALGALAVYGQDAVWPRKAQPAAMFVLVPVVSWLVMAIAVPTAALISRRR